MNSLHDQLAGAVAAHDLVRIERRRFRAADRETHGFLVVVSDELVLLSLMSDRIDLDGYEVLRTADLTACEREFPRKAFYLKALKLKGESPQVPPALDLTNMRVLLSSAQVGFPLLVVHREHVASGECVIGRLKLTSEDAFAVRYIDPDGCWMDDTEHYRYADVTRVGFGGEYENTLAAVAGVAV
jgi:hypothetical protein